MKSFRLPRIYPLTDVQVSGLSHAEQIRRLCAGGASLVQFREKGLPASDFYDEAQAALRVTRELGIRLIINDRVDVALALGADGVHLGQDDLAPTAARELLGENAIIGLSTHNMSQALEAQKAPIDYLAIGPIFSTTTKQDTSPVVGLADLAEVRLITKGLPLVAIGGITEANAAEVIQAGADSVAVVSSLLSSPQDISQRTNNFIELLGK
ncbi:MAG TPA: thiamine phosphate synthase [Pyrinomonadaceae bacterium]